MPSAAQISVRLAARRSAARPADVLVPLRYRTDQGELSLFSTTSVLGTPLDVTLAELAVESFFPTDESSADILRSLA
ncbi:MAG: hypothetical protein H0V92_11330 [Pseudonocardiales bacterium]|nr:hypothetical protein [Pseudonocardiales bacterium]